jgi:hypothetical protein
MRVDELRRLESIHVRHADIEQHDRELIMHELIERLPAGVRQHQILAELAQDRLIGEQPCGLVIDQQDVHAVIDCHSARSDARTAPQGCSHSRTSDSSWSVFTGLAT